MADIKTWFIALRPWSFTAAAVPVALGSVLAWNEGYFHPLLFLLVLIGGIAMQAGTNLINTYGDYISGVDTEESAKTCPQLVKKILEPEQMKRAGILCFAFVALLGLYFVYLRGWPILLLGILGIIGGYGYTAGVAYKYKGLGTIMVFFLMGPMMVWGAYYMQTGIHSWTAVWVSIPVGLLVSGILHANDLRDMEHDQRAGIKTLALFLGKKIGVPFYYALNTGAYVTLIILIITGQLPWLALLPLLLLPQFWQILKNTREAARGNKEKLQFLEASAAQFHFKFGSLFVAGLLINLII